MFLVRHVNGVDGVQGLSLAKDAFLPLAEMRAPDSTQYVKHYLTEQQRYLYTIYKTFIQVL